MNTSFPVPFYPNTPDNTHCFQACLRMVLKYFQPDKDYSWKELEVISAKKEGLWTWPTAAMMWMKNRGFDVKDIEMFDYDEFVKDGEKYLRKLYGTEAGNEQIKHSDIAQEIDYAKQFLKLNAVTKEIPTKETLKELLKEKYLLMCLINAQRLDHESGYVGHFVIVKGFCENEFIIHDPGLPPMENRKVSIAEFEAAWAFPNERAKNVMAFRL